MPRVHSRTRTGWVVTCAGFGINILVGVPYAWSLFAEGLVNQLGWTQATAAAPYSLFLFFYAFSMIPAGRLQDHFGPKAVVSLGALLAGSGLIVSGLFTTPVAATLSWGLLVGCGMACCFAAVTPAAMLWFPDSRKGLISGIVVTGVGISAFLLAPVIDWLVDVSVRRALLVSGIVLSVAIALLAQLVSVPPHQHRVAERIPGKISAVRSPLFARFWLAFFLTTSSGIVVVTHLATLTRVHTGVGTGFLTVSMFALFNACGRIVGGIMSDSIGRLRSIRTAFLGLLVALGAIYASGSLAGLVPAVSLLGLFYGSLFGIFPAATATLFGHDNFGLKYGIVFSAIAFSGTLSWSAGTLFERYGTFHPAILGLIVMCIVAIALSFTFGTDRTGE